MSVPESSEQKGEESKKTRAPNWISDEIEPMVSWLECEENYERTKNQSRDSWMLELAALVPSRTVTQVAHKYDNMIQEYKKARQAAQRSKWSLREEDYKNDPDRWEDLNRKAKFFFRLDAIYGNRPNITPPLLYDQGSVSSQNTDHEILQLAEASCIASTNTTDMQLQDDRDGQLERMREIRKPSGGKGKEKVKVTEFVDNNDGVKRRGGNESEDQRQNKKKRMNDKESPVEKSIHSLSVEQALRAEKAFQFQQEKMTKEYDMRQEENKDRKMQFQMEMDERRAERMERAEEREMARQRDQEKREMHARSFDLQFKALELKLSGKKE